MPKLTVTNLLTGPYEIQDTSGLFGPDGSVFHVDLAANGTTGYTQTVAISEDQLQRLQPQLDAAQTASKLTWSWVNDTTNAADDLRRAVRVALVTPAVMTVDDEILLSKLTSPSAVAVTLPANPPVGMVIDVIDATGDAGSNHITVSPASGTVNGGANVVIATNYGRATFTRYATEWLGVLVAPAGAPTGTAGGDLSGSYPNPNVAQVAGVAQSADMVPQKVDVTIGNAALKTMHTTPVSVIAAPAAGSFIELVSVHARIVYATAAFDGVTSSSYLELRSTNASGQLLTQNVNPVGFADQSSTQDRLLPLTQGGAAFVTPVDNAAVVAHIAAAEWFTAAGGGALHLEILYRIRTTAI